MSTTSGQSLLEGESKRKKKKFDITKMPQIPWNEERPKPVRHHPLPLQIMIYVVVADDYRN